MNWYKRKFNELSIDELYNLIKARIDVFVVEQQCPYPELDNYDQLSIHYFLKVNNEVAAYVRILPKNTKYIEASIGRLLVVERYRGKGYAKKIMKNAIQYIKDEWKETEVKIQAQQYLYSFYSSLGFIQVSDVYLEDEIPHINMILRHE